jgi:hypothetical protein
MHIYLTYVTSGASLLSQSILFLSHSDTMHTILSLVARLTSQFASMAYIQTLLVYKHISPWEGDVIYVKSTVHVSSIADRVRNHQNASIERITYI